MRAIRVVELYELLVDMIEVAEAETHEVIQALALDGADPRFSKRVGVWAPGLAFADDGCLRSGTLDQTPLSISYRDHAE